MEKPTFLRSSALARSAGVSAGTLRNYEARGLLPGARRSPNGYREFSADAAHRVRLIRRAVALGFTLEELARILRVRDAGGAPCRTVRKLAGDKLALLTSRLKEITAARDQLVRVLEQWDAMLADSADGRPVGLLEALEGVVEAGAPSPLMPAALRARSRA